MGSLLFFAFSWWGILLRVVAIVHFVRRRPDFFWLWIILFHWVGALVYIVVEVIPDAGLLRTQFQVFPRRRRIRELERAILDNPSAGNYEELGLLYLDNRDYARARGIRFIGDMPIFVAGDSADIWSRPELFQLDEFGHAGECLLVCTQPHQIEKAYVARANCPEDAVVLTEGAGPGDIPEVL